MIVFFERIRAMLRAEDPESWRRLGIAYGRSGQWSKALVALDHALHLDPQDGDSLEVKGDIFLATMNPELAVACYRDAARFDLGHRNPQRWSNLGVAYAKLGRREDALNAYRKALEHDLKNPTIWRNIITEFFHADKPHDLAAACEDAVRHVPNDPHIWYDFGCALEKLGYLAKAAEVFAEAWRLRPDFPGPWMQLIAVRVKLKRFDEAAAVCGEMAQFRRKDYGHALSHLCENYILVGHHAGAEEVIHTLSKIDPDSATRLRKLLVHQTAKTT